MPNILYNPESQGSIIHGTFAQILTCGLLLRGKSRTDLAKHLGISFQAVQLYTAKKSLHGWSHKHHKAILEFLNADLICLSDGTYTIILK